VIAVPEELRRERAQVSAEKPAVRRSTRGAVAETVGRFDGFVAKYMGDGVLVYFDYPQAARHWSEGDSNYWLRSQDTPVSFAKG
jgi:class 3 adenylate cyclase